MPGEENKFVIVVKRRSKSSPAPSAELRGHLRRPLFRPRDHRRMINVNRLWFHIPLDAGPCFILMDIR